MSTNVLDLVFALDGSDSLTTVQFEKLKEFVLKSLHSYDISRENTHVGVIEYSDQVSVKIPLHQFSTAQQLKEAVQNIQPSKGRGVLTDQVLDKAAKEVFSPSSGGRPGASKALVILTDDPSFGSRPVSEAVKPLQAMGVFVTVVAIGNRVPGRKISTMFLPRMKFRPRLVVSLKLLIKLSKKVSSQFI